MFTKPKLASKTLGDEQPLVEEDANLMLAQEPKHRLKRLKSIIKIVALVLFIIMINSLTFSPEKAITPYLTAISILLLLYKFMAEDTTNIVAGMLLWLVTILASYFAWKHHGLFDTAILVFPCILIYAAMLGSRSFTLPILLFMILIVYAFAWASSTGFLEGQVPFTEGLWGKANQVAVILALYTFSIGLLMGDIKILMQKLLGENKKVSSAQKQAEILSHFNRLTRLPNEQVCKEQLSFILDNTESRDDIVALLTLDLDKFQWINSSLGHEVGDKFLIDLAQRLVSFNNENIDIYHVNGNVFLATIEAKDYEEISEFAHQLLHATYRTFYIDDYELEVTASIGIATAPFDGDNFDTLRHRSEIALSHAKKQENNSFRYFDLQMEKDINARMSMVQDLKRAIENKEFEIYYQPKVELTSEKMIGAEALIRWHRPEHGIVSPADFIPVAESSGLISEIGKWLLYEACQHCKTWHTLGFHDFSIAVNLSPIQFRRGNLPSIVSKALKHADLSANYLELEITESLFIDDTEHVKEQIHAITAKGVSMAIDDFGTGYSNLNYLTNFNASTLKIDRSFIKDLLTSAQHLHIVNAIIQMSQVMEIDCIAEGIEDTATWDILKSLGCQYGQGYYWSEPLPYKEFCRLAQNHIKHHQSAPA
ncbi:hypothetical protein C2869_08175 [Saccharobesus litoralis]|uniref:cyclic-guanylate-specific phosphodiesterase n=1 Tax=Saccharobesus litoralis TaxID=2172099 RepID=A0A2S0VQB4_9ALTE|nr:bifunctional diguanylate cyclase/phosphodiesterase [Saccharobesus litoralis]AWB66406.1 hypothetical protein C2869_08175 [Saccharobesus litoralis]